jgi:DNA-binding NarL/FixJ family response regulator
MLVREIRPLAGLRVRILVADDHDVIRTGLRALLEAESDFEVCGEATDGREALQKANELKPDVLILDLSMPKLNGLEVTRRVHKMCPQVEVLILTVQDSEQILQLLAEGKGTKEIATQLDITLKTAQTHRRNIMRKLDLHHVTDLVRYAIRNQVVQT